MTCIWASLLLSQVAVSQCPNLVWADEFDGESLDESNWNYQLGDGCDLGICGWGNNELQYYQQENVTVSDGILKITAKKEQVDDHQYTSARINTNGKRQWTYGRMEARIKLPDGGGLWPAFWMLPSDKAYGGWPRSGEIDIMEFVGHEPDKVLGTIHYGKSYQDHQLLGGDFKLFSGRFPDDYHEFAIEWEDGEIRWMVDDILYSTKTAAEAAPYDWPFDQNFHFLLNVAVGGNLGGAVHDSIFPVTMEVDYVRVYDGYRPYIRGSRTVANAASGEIYTIGNVSDSTQVTWTVPAGATIVSGQGSPTLTVDWGASGGPVSASIITTCDTLLIEMEVFVESTPVKEYSFENFDESPTAKLGIHTGTLSEVSNPAPDTVNASGLCGRYQRNTKELYDVLIYNVNTITNADDYVNGDKKIYIDIYTDAPVGTEILLQLETLHATPRNFPNGRHSRYVATITENNRWQRLEFKLLDEPDEEADSANISRLVLLFRSESFTGDVYYFDNLDSMKNP